MDDKKPSLIITYDGGKWLLRCFAGCSVKEILDEVGLDVSDGCDGCDVSDGCDQGEDKGG